MKEGIHATKLGYEIRLYRNRHNMSQQAFGDLLGVSANTVHLWERKGARPSMSSMIALARVMEIPLDKIMRDSMTDYTDI